jgi:hypothetical protein
MSGFGYLLIVRDSCEGVVMARSISTGVFTFHEPGFEGGIDGATWKRSNCVDICRRGARQGLNIPARPQFSLNTGAIDYSLVRLYSRQEKKVFKFPIR